MTLDPRIDGGEMKAVDPTQPAHAGHVMCALVVIALVACTSPAPEPIPDPPPSVWTVEGDEVLHVSAPNGTELTLRSEEGGCMLAKNGACVPIADVVATIDATGRRMGARPAPHPPTTGTP